MVEHLWEITKVLLKQQLSDHKTFILRPEKYIFVNFILQISILILFLHQQIYSAL